MYTHNSLEQMTKQKERRQALIEEGVSGITKKDTLPNTSFPLYGESEAMYFRLSRNFLRTSLAKRILDISQDVFMGELYESGL